MIQTQESKTKSVTVDLKLCGAVKLFCAIKGYETAEVLLRFGIIPAGYKRCDYCGRLFDGYNHGVYCSPECNHKAKYTFIACDNCGKLFERLTTNLVWVTSRRGSKYAFCSKFCQGQYMGIHFGTKACVQNHYQRKYNYDMVWQTHLQTGYGTRRLARLLNIGEPSISKILHKKRTEIIVWNNNE
jgi:hypothetical protein